MASIYEVARQAGVSPATVSRVFNRRGNVAGPASVRVLAAATALGYSPQQSARRDTIAVVMAPFARMVLGGYHAGLVTALAHALQRRRLRLELIGSDEVAENHDHLLAGVILASATGGDAAQRFPGCSVVSINNRFPGVPAVCSNEKQALHLGLAHLRERGWRRPALFLMPGGGSANRERKTHFKAAVKRLDMVGCWQSAALETDVAAAVAAGADALVVASEQWGIRVLAALHRLGLRPGVDVAILGWEVPGVSNYLMPALTTIAQDLDGLAEAALDRLAGMATGDLRLPCTLIERDSVPMRRGTGNE